MEAVRAADRGDGRSRAIGMLYRDWGIPTPISLVEAGVANLPLIATGGVRSGLDIARALSLGATLVGMAFPFLKAASESFEAVCELVEELILELKVAMQLSGAASVAQMTQVDVVVTGETYHWLKLRGFEAKLRELAQRRLKTVSWEGRVLL
jgi:isopentenyl-diphosphate delta-isomerase